MSKRGAGSPKAARTRKGRNQDVEQEDAIGLQDARAETDQLAEGLDTVTEAATSAPAAAVMRERVDGEKTRRFEAEEKLKAAEAKQKELEQKIAELSQIAGSAGGSPASTPVSNGINTGK
jgi:DNA-binding ferritin-like protein